MRPLHTHLPECLALRARVTVQRPWGHPPSATGLLDLDSSMMITRRRNRDAKLTGLT